MPQDKAKSSLLVANSQKKMKSESMGGKKFVINAPSSHSGNPK
jgi:ABC-type phosphate/phosphonate transport system substrate-binding protein